MSRKFDPLVPEDIEFLQSLVRINPNVELEMIAKSASTHTWFDRQNYSLKEGKREFCGFSIFNLYRIKEDQS